MTQRLTAIAASAVTPAAPQHTDRSPRSPKEYTFLRELPTLLSACLLKRLLTSTSSSVVIA